LPFGPVDSYQPGTIDKLSVNVTNLFLLIFIRTIEQAMADYIDVIAWAKKKWQIPSTTPLISFGGSYPGDLTTYLRVAYPDIIDAGLASSAPLNYHAGMIPGGEFFRV